jgi:hypothetical protein
MAWVCERTPSKLVPTFADRRCRIVSTTDRYGRIFAFLDRCSHFVFQVAPQLYSTRLSGPRSRATTQKTGGAGNRTGTSGSVARNSYHYTTKTVPEDLIKPEIQDVYNETPWFHLMLWKWAINTQMS